MNIKKYLLLSDKKLLELENKYQFLPNEEEIDNLKLSADKACLKETARIARLHALQRQTEKAEKLLAEKRKQDILSRFIRPE